MICGFIENKEVVPYLSFNFQYFSSPQSNGYSSEICMQYDWYLIGLSPLNTSMSGGQNAFPLEKTCYSMNLSV